MSIRLMTMVWERYQGSGNELLLALAIADHAHDDGTSIFPSVKTLAEKTRQSERTVQRMLGTMVDTGWLLLVALEINTKELKRGREYRVSPAWMGLDSIAQNTGDRLTPVHPDTGDRLTPETGDKLTPTRVTKSTDTGDTAMSPKPSIQPSIEPSIKHTPEIPADLLAAWKEVRKAKRAGAITEIVWKGLVREATAAGIDPIAAVEMCCERGWQSFRAEYVKSSRTAPAAGNKQEAMESRNRSATSGWMPPELRGAQA